MPEQRLWTLSNGLTMGRILLVPVFCLLALQESALSSAAAIAVFLIASITDAYDGKLARARNEITDFGKLADPIADKALTGAAFILLSAAGEFPWWATVAVLVREVGITVWRLSIRGRVVHAAGAGGKLKTTMQIVAICLALWPKDALLGGLIHPLGILALWLAAIVTIYTGIVYAQELRRS